MSLPFRVLGDRVVVKADREEHAPEVTESGLVIAKTLAAAVEGSDAEDSWFVGTVVDVGPLVNRFEIRPWLQRRIAEMEQRQIESYEDTLQRLKHELDALPTDCPDPVQIGDRVTFSWAAGQQITVDGDRYLILRQSDVLAVLEPESEAA